MSPLASNDVWEDTLRPTHPAFRGDRRTAAGAEPEEAGLASDDDSTDLAVVSFLETFDGWVWRANIKVEFGWSTARTRAVLERMEADGTIARHRDHGAEVVAIPGHAPGVIADRT